MIYLKKQLSTIKFSAFFVQACIFQSDIYSIQKDQSLFVNQRSLTVLMVLDATLWKLIIHVMYTLLFMQFIPDDITIRPKCKLMCIQVYLLWLRSSYSLCTCGILTKKTLRETLQIIQNVAKKLNKQIIEINFT